VKVHHIGYLVDDINSAINEFERLGYTRQTSLLYDSVRQFHAIFIMNNGYVLELLQPTNKDSSIWGLRKRFKNSPYHICYSTFDIEAETMNLCAKGHTLLDPIRTVHELEGKPRISFLFSPQIGIIELMESGDSHV